MNYDTMPAGREMDALVAERVMGGFVSDPDAWANTSEVWYWRHPRSGVLRGLPWLTPCDDDGKAWYDHSWKDWKPSANIADAWHVLERMRSQIGTDVWDRFIAASIITFDYKVSTLMAELTPLAICRAALNAVDSTWTDINQSILDSLGEK